MPKGMSVRVLTHKNILRGEPDAARIIVCAGGIQLNIEYDAIRKALLISEEHKALAITPVSNNTILLRAHKGS